jgi:hypothetical protein
VTFGARALHGEDRKELASALEEAVRAQLEPMEEAG